MGIFRRSVAAALIGSPLFAPAAHAQCPNGSPPPCRVVAKARPAALALNPRGWIVVPFANAMRVADLEWVRDAAVNMMSLDMQRWTDISVVPDKRVADLLRTLPASRAGQPLGLEDGLALARRAGVGTLVMGDFFKTGGGARLVANVFDVKTGARLRSVTQQAAAVDSLLVAFGPLTHAVLALPPPTDGQTGDVGTSRIDAYQAYLAGVKARNSMRLREAEQAFRESLKLDSTFARAHAELANVLAWGASPKRAAERLPRALAAERLGTKLPARERALIRASVAYARRDYPAMCAAAAPLVRADSTDVEAMFALVSCNTADDALVAVDDSTWRYRADPNIALRLAKAILRTDPSFYPAFEQLAQLLLVETRYPCPADKLCRSSGELYQALLVVRGDTIVTRFPRDTVGIDLRRREYVEQSRAKTARRLARSVVDDWVASDPTNMWAHQARAEVLHLLNEGRAAYAELHRVPIPASPENPRGPAVALEINVALGNAREARAWHDSLRKATREDTAANVIRLRRYDFVFGREKRLLAPVDSAELKARERGELPAALRASNRELLRVFGGIPSPTLAAAESLVVFARPDSSCDLRCRFGRLQPLLYTYQTPRPWLVDSLHQFLDAKTRAVVRRDTVAMLRLAREAEAFGRNAPADANTALWDAAMLFLAAGDSLSTLRIARSWLDTVFPSEFFGSRRNGFIGSPMIAVWVMRLRGELAVALGYPDEGAKWLDRVLDLWAEADQGWPDVERLRGIRATIKTRIMP